MILVITEKPSVAQSIAKVIGATSRKDGYMEGNNYIVSWCVGHLVGLADASSYDDRYAKWRYSDLPIVPEEWLYEVPKDKAHGDFACNIAMLLAKPLRMAPAKIAAGIIDNMEKSGSVERVEVAGAGFINFYLNSNWLYETMRVI